MTDVTDFTKRIPTEQGGQNLSPINQVPKVVVWFKVYSGIMAFLNLVVIILGLVFMFMKMPGVKVEDMIGSKIVGAVYFAMGIIFIIPYFMALFLPPKPWVWVFSIVLICVGFTSCCTLPFCIAMLVFWLKPQTRIYYGRVS